MKIGIGIGIPSSGLMGRAAASSNTFDVLPSSGSPTYTVTTDVLNSSGTVFSVLATVLSSDGTSYSPI